MLTVVVTWNTLLFLGWRLNGSHEALVNLGSRAILGATSLAVGALALAIVTSERLRSAVVAPSRAHLYDPAPFLIVGVACIGMGVAALVAATGVVF